MSLALGGTFYPSVYEKSYLRISTQPPGLGQLPWDLQIVPSKGSVLNRTAALMETPLWFPAPIWCLETICNSNSRGSDDLFSPLGECGLYVVNKHACTFK